MATIVALGLAAAVVYGTSDFLGGFASRALASVEVTFLAFFAGTLMCGALLPLVATRWSLAALGYGAIAGVAAAASIWLLYSALALGPASILAPMIAVIAALVPVGYGLSRGERLGSLGGGAIAVVLISGGLLACDPGGRGARPSARALLTGLAAGLATGAYLVSLAFTPADSGAAPVLVEFAVGTALVGLAFVAFRPGAPGQAQVNRPVLIGRTAMRLAVVSGVTQALADVLAIVGIHRGDLAVMAALMALYPLGTLACAWVVTRERVSPVQGIGIVLAVAASAVLAAGGRL